MNKQKSLSVAERYRQTIASRQPEIIDVTAPSGFIFKFQKPSKFALLFNGDMLQLAEPSEENQIQLAKQVFNIRDKVLLLSVDPKIVTGKAKNANEISTEDIADDDLAYLFKWVAAAGADEAAMKSMFPVKPERAAATGGAAAKQ